MKSSAYKRGLEQGRFDAENFRKKKPQKHLSAFQKLSLGVNQSAQDFITGYNNGYHEILRERKKEKAAEKVDGSPKEATSPSDEIAIKKAMLEKMNELKALDELLKEAKNDLEL